MIEINWNLYQTCSFDGGAVQEQGEAGLEDVLRTTCLSSAALILIIF